MIIKTYLLSGIYHISLYSLTSYSNAVAPHAGAWIETNERDELLDISDFVAPHAGAWIETQRKVRQPYLAFLSRLTQARGLKHPYVDEDGREHIKSRLTQARGLKHPNGSPPLLHAASRLTQARGLKL